MIKNFNSKKFFILLTIVCLLFLILVINAFMYLPQNSVNEDIAINRENAVNRQIASNENEQQEETQQTAEEEKPQKTLNVKLPKDEVDIIELDSPPGVNVSQEESATIEVAEKELSSEEKAEGILKEAANFRASKQYIKALDEYQKVLTETTDINIKASAYDGIASLYAINKRYGTALTYAIKAYNMFPTSQREMTLARLYYKTGDIAKATQRVNNILRREFADDKW